MVRPFGLISSGLIEYLANTSNSRLIPNTSSQRRTTVPLGYGTTKRPAVSKHILAMLIQNTVSRLVSASQVESG